MTERDAEILAGAAKHYERRTEALDASAPKPLGRSLEETIAAARAACERRQTETEQDVAAKGPEGQRVVEGRQLVLTRLPPFVAEPPPKALRGRISDPRLFEVATTWEWGSLSYLLAGPTGLGKTTAAAFLVRRLVAKSARAGGFDWELAKRIRWAKANELSRARQTHPFNQGEPPKVLDAMNASLLVLDDLGWDSETPVIRDVLNHRYEAVRAPTIVTTGHAPEDVLARYGDAVTRQMFEAGGKGKIVSVFPEKKQA